MTEVFNAGRSRREGLDSLSSDPLTASDANLVANVDRTPRPAPVLGGARRFPAPCAMDRR